MTQDSTNPVRDAKPIEWRGTSRYEVLARLGQGGMGIVYEAFDRERRQLVALKTLRAFDPTALYRFKREFRSIAGVLHTNLVRLYELVVPEEGKVFFTMELVRGVDFQRHVRRDGGRSSDAPADTVVGARQARADEGTGGPQRMRCEHPAAGRKLMPADEGRLRAALRQLAQGVFSVHAAGKLHRDLKPSNVLVTAEGRVVLLDFGVATELSSMQSHLDADEANEIVGTARYMAPEQGCETATAASDWYSVGVMLYEALVGHPPFTGSVADVLALKSTVDAQAPSECAAGIPRDLEALCMALLQRAPEARPSGKEILERLGVRPSSAPPVALVGVSDLDVAFMGRESQLASLREAFEATRSGVATTVRVSGAAGMGKSTVVNHFVDDLARRGEAVVLRARAYEREAVPYKAVDGTIDALTHHLLSVVEHEPSFELPEGIGTAARLFPVLQRIPRVQDAAEAQAGDPQAVRRRAFEALRQVFAVLVRRQPLVVALDDVHWGDVDSASLLLEVLRGPGAPALLVVMTFRDDEAKASPFLREIGERWPVGVRTMDVTVGPLDPEDARRLAACLLEDSGETARRIAAAAARESNGSPFLIEEFVRCNRSAAAESEAALSVFTLEQMVGERLDRLPAGARQLIEVLAVGGRPLPPSVIAAASAVTGGLDEAIALLGARRFVRAGQRDGRDVVETTHDRIRETVVALLPRARLREHHEALARTLEGAAGADPESIALHWLGAGDAARAVRFAEQAAERSAEKLAFDRAVRLLRLALEHTPTSSEHAQSLRARLAVALQDGGRCSESAQVYIDAAARAAPEQRIAFQRGAAEQLLTAGRIDEGAEMLRSVLRVVGIRAPRSPLAAVFWLAVYRLWLALLGLRFRERQSSEVRLEDRVRVDALFAASMCFAVVNVVLGRCMQVRHLIEALRRGDRFQVMRATSIEASHLSASGGPESARERALYAIGRHLAEREGTQEARAYADGARGMGFFLRGRWREAREFLERGLEVPFYGNSAFSSVRLFGAYAALFLGDLNEYRRRIAKLLAEADERGDLYTRVNLSTASVIRVALAAGDPEGARRAVREALDLWPQRGFLVQHWQGIAYGTDADLYEGDPGAAYERLKRAMPHIKKSFLLRAAYIRVVTWSLLGRLAIASIRSDPGLRAARIAEARRIARRLDREHDAWPKSMAAQIRACAAAAAGDRTAAITELHLALARLETPNDVWAWSANHRLGLLLGGDEGRELVRRAVEVMRAQGIQDPERWAYMYLPGDDWS
jgi:serine/threonine protein kinase